MAHLSGTQLQQAVAHAATLVSVGNTYSHYKHPDHHYTVIGLGILEADDSLAVIYQAQYGEKLTFIRPLTSWLDTVSLEGEPVPRFSLLTDTEYK